MGRSYPNPLWRTAGAPGPEQLRLPLGVVRLVTLVAATAAGPSLVTFARLPLAGPGSTCMILE